MIREYIVRIDDSLKNADKDIDELEMKWGAEELPKGHGKLIDADAFERRCMFDSDIIDMQDVIYALRDYKSIIEADKAKSEEV